MAGYCDKRGVAISESKWRELQADYEYVVTHEYENDKLLVECVWTGRVDSKAHEMFWEPFSVIIWHRFHGKWVEESETHTFGDSGDAVDFYKKYLSEHTDCYFNDLGQLVEVDNIAAERRHKAIQDQRDKQAEKERIARDKEALREEALRKVAQEKARIEKEKANELRMAAELEEIQRIASRGDSYGGW